MKKQQKSSWKAIAFPLVLGGLGVLSGYYGMIFVKSFLPPRLMALQGAGETIVFIALAFFAIWVAIAFHELGHLVAGLAHGFRIALYTAGLLGVRGTERGVRLFLNRHISLMGGLAATFPEHLQSGPELRRTFARIVAAGPLASLLLCVAAFIGLSVLLQNPGDSASPALRAGVVFLLFTGGISGLIFAGTMIPSRSGGFMSDGARLLSLLNGGEKSRYEEAVLSVTALLGAGKLPSEYPADLIERLTARAPDSFLGFNGHFIAFTHYFDRGETDRALPLARIVEDHISAVPKAFEGHYLKEVVFFHAFLAGDAEAAHAHWAAIQKQAERDPDAALLRVEAALALLDGQTEAAGDFARKGLVKITDLPFEGQRRFEEKWLRAVLQKVQERQQAGATGR